MTSAILVFHPDHEDDKRRQYKAFESWVKKHPEWPVQPSQSETSQHSEKYYWFYQRHAIQDWLKDLARRQLEDELGLHQNKEQTSSVIR